MGKRFNKERCCIYYVGFVHSIFIGTIVLCGLYLRGYVVKVNGLIDDINSLVQSAEELPYSAFRFIRQGEELYDYIHTTLYNNSALVKNTRDKLYIQLDKIDEARLTAKLLGSKINNTLHKLEDTFGYINFLTTHFSRKEIIKFTNDVNSTLINTRRIVDDIRNITQQLQRDVSTIPYASYLNRTQTNTILYQ